MHHRHTAHEARRAREFEAFVAGAGSRLLHAATLLTAESPEENPRARRLLTAALAHTYAVWDRLHGEDPYACTRQQLALRFARTAWHQYGSAPRPTAVPKPRAHLPHPHLPQALRTRLRRSPRRPERPGPRGVLRRLGPQERLILVLRLYEGVAEEQTAALLGLPPERVRALCARAVSTLLHPPAEAPSALAGPAGPRPS
ncbi:sigma factor-like helix-turn-helix DNA-binding protein [Streptomyces sp. NPDC058045]|uniref:sigma factor-like helix-turn-helix DNA-binding protein n=1 Tax=Streptomyces sp. NPDC058045 TaxID=3346311 RepID=UPI0036EA6557